MKIDFQIFSTNIDFFKASSKSAEVFGGEIHNTLISRLPKNLA